jgi:hypothetical protein
MASSPSGSGSRDFAFTSPTTPVSPASSGASSISGLSGSPVGGSPVRQLAELSLRVTQIADELLVQAPLSPRSRAAEDLRAFSDLRDRIREAHSKRAGEGAEASRLAHSVGSPQSLEQRVVRVAGRCSLIQSGSPLGKGGAAVVVPSFRLTDEGEIDRSSPAMATRLQPMVADPTVFARTIEQARFSYQLHQLAHQAAPDDVIEIHSIGFDTTETATTSSVIFQAEMERAASDLENLIQKGNPSAARKREVVQSLIQGLGRLHAAGIWHLDIKPANVLIARDGRPKWADFERGNSAVMLEQARMSRPTRFERGELRQAMEHLATRYNTPLYSPPEAWDPSIQGTRQDPVMGPRYDLFSLGCTIWRVLFNTMPPSLSHRVGTSGFGFLNPRYGAITPEAHEKMVHDVESMPDSPEKTLLQLACRCLHPDREQRPQDAAEVQRMLEALLPPAPMDVDRRHSI